jgi:hypothetical protein
MRLDRGHISDFLISKAALSKCLLLNLGDEEGDARLLRYIGLSTVRLLFCLVIAIR